MSHSWPGGGETGSGVSARNDSGSGEETGAGGRTRFEVVLERRGQGMK